MKKITALIAAAGTIAALSAGCGGQTQTPAQHAAQLAKTECPKLQTEALAEAHKQVAGLPNVSAASEHQLALAAYRVIALSTPLARDSHGHVWTCKSI